MTKTFILLFKDSQRIESYTTISAIFTAYRRKELGVSRSTLARIDWGVDYFSSDIVRIEMSITKTSGDIKRERVFL